LDTILALEQARAETIMLRQHSRILIIGSLALSWLLRAENEDLQVLYDFGGPGPGASALVGTVAVTADGSIYGVSHEGTDTSGANGYGTVFRIAPDGTLAVLFLFHFPSGAYPWGIIEGPDGALYGTTEIASPATHGGIFRITPSGNLTNIFGFYGTNGFMPRTPLTVGRDSYFYGTTDHGGIRMREESEIGDGTVFKFSPEGDFQTLVLFNGTNGSLPTGRLLQARDGNLYGNTAYGGPYGHGTVFKVSPSGEFTSVFSFAGTNGSAPSSGLTEGEDGTLYGTTSGTGLSPLSTVYKVTTNGILTILAVFNGANGRLPTGPLFRGVGGEFYGATVLGGAADGGTIFKLTYDGRLTTLFSFKDETGMWVNALSMGADGNLYGTTTIGGRFGWGTVFRIVQRPKIASTRLDGAVNLTWNSFTGGVYQVQYTTDLNMTNWLVAAERIKALGTSTSLVQLGDATTTLFYRVALLPW
jgi:uncharacterized repeat protein (TIGR03803 family)